MYKTKRHYKLNIVVCTLICGIILLLMKTPISLYIQASEFNNVSNHTFSMKPVDHLSTDDLKHLSQKEVQQDSQVSHQEVVNIMEQFMKTLVQDTDENYKVTGIESKYDLLKEFETISTEVIAKEYVDFYYEEIDDGLYIIPTETPPWFISDNPYDIVQIDEKQVQITQTNQSDLFGTYTIKIELTYHDNWRITDIKHL